MAKNRRLLKNIFVDSNLAARFGLVLLISWVFILAVTIGLQYFMIQQLESNIAQSVNLPTPALNLFDDFFLYSSITQVILFIIFGWILLAFITIMNHRIYGPIGVIQDFIACLKQGNYNPPKKSLREKDELVPIMDDLNDLALKLQKN